MSQIKLAREIFIILLIWMHPVFRILHMLGGNVLYLSRVCEHMHACASLHRCELNCKGFKHISSLLLCLSLHFCLF